MRSAIALATVFVLIVTENVYAVLGNFLPHGGYLAILVGTLLITLGARNWEVLHLAAYVVLSSLCAFLPFSILGVSAIRLLLVFGLSLLVILPLPQFRNLLAWFGKGTLDRVSIGLMILTSTVAAGALILWAETSQQLGIGLQMMRSVAHLPSLLVLGLGIPLFAALNAFAEEVVYRGVFQEALSRVLPDRWLVVVTLQSSAFAALHYTAGFPNGTLGYAMVFGWGGMLGYLRTRTRGILAAYLVHIAADLVILYYLWLQV